MHDYRTELFQAQQWLAQLIKEVDPQQHTDPTPCTEFDVGDLLGHLLMDVELLEQLPELQRDSSPGEKDLEDEDFPAKVQRYKERHVLGRTGAQIAEVWERGARGSQEKWTDAALAKDYLMPWGTLYSGVQAVGMYLGEIVCHGYDLAKATGQPVEAPRAVAEAALVVAHELVQDSDRHEGTFHAAQPAPAGAGPTVQLAAFLGREMQHS